MHVRCTLIVLCLNALVVAQTATPAKDTAKEKAPDVKAEQAEIPEFSLDPDWPKNVKPFSLDAPTMTDDWFQVGPALRDMGIDSRFYYNNTFFSVLKGGRDTGGGKNAATYDWIVSFDFDKMGLIPNAEALLDVRGQFGGSGINRYTGANQQVVDDADFEETIYIDMLWYRQHFLDHKLSLQLGYLDFQTIVDRNKYANSEDKQFMNAALDNNPLFPTASAAGLGIALYVRPCDWYELIVGTGDAQRFPLYNPTFGSTFHDEAWFLMYVENNLKVHIPSPNGKLDGNYRFGMIYDPTPKNQYRYPWQSAKKRGNDVGWYMSFDQELYKENKEDNQGLGTFFRYSWRRGDIPHDAGFFHEFWSTGLSYTGLIPERDKDTLGLAVAQLMSSERYRSRINRWADNETIYELYYAIHLTPWFVLTPDIQYIDNPGGIDNQDPSHAIAGGFRIRVTF